MSEKKIIRALNDELRAEMYKSDLGLVVITSGINAKLLQGLCIDGVQHAALKERPDKFVGDPHFAVEITVGDCQAGVFTFQRLKIFINQACHFVLSCWNVIFDLQLEIIKEPSCNFPGFFRINSTCRLLPPYTQLGMLVASINKFGLVALFQRQFMGN